MTSLLLDAVPFSASLEPGGFEPPVSGIGNASALPLSYGPWGNKEWMILVADLSANFVEANLNEDLTITSISLACEILC